MALCLVATQHLHIKILCTQDVRCEIYKVELVSSSVSLSDFYISCMCFVHLLLLDLTSTQWEWGFIINRLHIVV